METLNLCSTAVDELPSSIRFLKKLEKFFLFSCGSLKNLPNGLSEMGSLIVLSLANCSNLDTSNLGILFEGLQSLVALFLDNCSNLFELPDNINLLSRLERLSMSGTKVEILPRSFKHLSQLRDLNLRDCVRIQCVSELPSSVQYLDVSNCSRLQSILQLPSSVESLRANNCHSLETVTCLTSKHISLNGPFNRNSRQYFSFGNCIKLDDHSIDNIMENFHSRMKHLSCKCCGELVYRYLNEQVLVCLPRKEVPN